MALVQLLSYPILQAKPGTRRMCAQDYLFHTHEHKVFTHSQMSQVKYIYYIINVSKDQSNSLVKRNSERLYNTTGTAIGVAHSLELHVEEF
jgi:hypothetical protein